MGTKQASDVVSHHSFVTIQPLAILPRIISLIVNVDRRADVRPVPEPLRVALNHANASVTAWHPKKHRTAPIIRVQGSAAIGEVLGPLDVFELVVWDLAAV